MSADLSAMDFSQAVTNGDIKENGLYNGNIVWQVNTVDKDGDVLSNWAAGIQGMAYQYDQLNRIKFAKSYRNFTTSWPTAVADTGTFKARYSYDANGNLQSLEGWGYYYEDPMSYGKVKFDELTYRYRFDGSGNMLHNQLQHVNDGGSSILGNDLEDQGNIIINGDGSITGKNYFYDEIGNLVRDNSEKIDTIIWDNYGKVAEVHYLADGNGDVKDLYFTYDGMGNRATKKYLLNDALQKLTYYHRDPQGNVMAVYEETEEGQTTTQTLTERHIYGSDRIGIEKTQIVVGEDDGTVGGSSIGGGGYLAREIYVPKRKFELQRGNRQYELKNHLGNVHVVISDLKTRDNSTSSGDVLYHNEIVAYFDYFPFGSLIEGRYYNNPEYRYGFGGHEQDDEVKGDGNHLAFGDYGYDPRAGRRWNIDPMAAKYPHISGYAAFHNNPIFFSDPTGLEPGDPLLPTDPKKHPVASPTYWAGSSFIQYEGRAAGIFTVSGAIGIATNSKGDYAVYATPTFGVGIVSGVISHPTVGVSSIKDVSKYAGWGANLGFTAGAGFVEGIVFSMEGNAFLDIRNSDFKDWESFEKMMLDPSRVELGTNSAIPIQPVTFGALVGAYGDVGYTFILYESNIFKDLKEGVKLPVIDPKEGPLSDIFSNKAEFTNMVLGQVNLIKQIEERVNSKNAESVQQTVETPQK